MRILLVEPDAATQLSIELMLEYEEMRVTSMHTGAEAITEALAFDYDLIILENRLPDMSGIACIKDIRKRNSPSPIIVLSGMNAVELKVEALRWGADDYIPKPFHKDELVARIHAVTRRAWGGHATSVIEIGELTVNLRARSAKMSGTHLHLTRKEYDILELLAHRQGKIVSRDAILTQLYNGHDEPEIKIIDVFICKLRRKLSLASTRGHNYVVTAWGRGYTLEEPQQLIEASAEPVRELALA